MTQHAHCMHRHGRLYWRLRDLWWTVVRDSSGWVDL